MRIQAYKKEGRTLYALTAYLGTHPVTGKQKNINKRGFHSKEKAKAYYYQELKKFKDANLSPADNTSITYAEIYRQWIEYYKTTVRESTLVKTETMFNLHILPVLGTAKVKNVTGEYLQKCVNQWAQQFAQYKKVFNYACLPLQYALIRGFIERHPKERVLVPKKGQSHPHIKTTKDFYTLEELKLFLNALQSPRVPPLWSTFFTLLTFTGLRCGEALALTWDDIDLTNGLLTVSKTLTRGKDNRLIIQPPKSKSGNRTISIDAGTVATLKNWRALQGKTLLDWGFRINQRNQLVFSKQSDNGYINLSKPRPALVKICKAGGVPMINVHGFRHTHASLLFESGESMQAVKERLGHSDIKITMNVYTHLAQATKDQTAERFASYVGNF